MTVPDFGQAAAEYARWRQGFPPRLFDWLKTLDVGCPDQHVLDVGTGTGLMARELARRGCHVTALDPSEALLAEAERAAASENLSISHVSGRAEQTGLPEGGFDVITAATCWHWFDRAAAAAECWRLLRPGGRLVIAHLDWLRREGNVIDLTLQAIHAVNPPPADRQWTFRYPDWLFELTDSGFDTYEVTAFPAKLTYSHDGWIGRIVASAQIGPALSSPEIEAFRTDLSERLANNPDPMAVEHRVFAIVLSRT